MKIQPFEQIYLNDLLQCWNQSLVYDPIEIERFTMRVLLDDNFDPSLLKIAVVDQRCVGFCYGVKRKVPYLERGLEPDRGWISMMAVAPNFQNLGIGTKLLKAVEEDLKDRGCKNITISAYSPNYFTPGIDLRYEKGISFFEKTGYTFTGEAVSMQRDLWNYVLPEETIKKIEVLEDKGIRIIHYHQKYMLQLLDFLLRNFGAGWKRNALIAMQNNEAEQTILLCVDANDKILGFCMRKIDGNDARFGPIGVSEELRSQGLGGVLLDKMMLEMKARNITYIYFLWTGGAAQRFYDRHGFHVYRTYQLARKELLP